MTGSRKRADGTVAITKLGQALAEEAQRYFDDHREEILAEENIDRREAA